MCKIKLLYELISSIILVIFKIQLTVRRGRRRVYANAQHIRELEDPTFKEDFRMSKPLFEVCCDGTIMMLVTLI